MGRGTQMRNGGNEAFQYLSGCQAARWLSRIRSIDVVRLSGAFARSHHAKPILPFAIRTPWIPSGLVLSNGMGSTLEVNGRQGDTSSYK